MYQSAAFGSWKPYREPRLALVALGNDPFPRPKAEKAQGCTRELPA